MMPKIYIIVISYDYAYNKSICFHQNIKHNLAEFTEILKVNKKNKNKIKCWIKINKIFPLKIT